MNAQQVQVWLTNSGLWESVNNQILDSLEIMMQMGHQWNYSGMGAAHLFQDALEFEFPDYIYHATGTDRIRKIKAEGFNTENIGSGITAMGAAQEGRALQDSHDRTKFHFGDQDGAEGYSGRYSFAALLRVNPRNLDLSKLSISGFEWHYEGDIPNGLLEILLEDQVHWGLLVNTETRDIPELGIFPQHCVLEDGSYPDY
jgi:hypothetical protein